ncbi:MAG TPA: hypothetical protein VHV77_07380 [Pirellulales bacterium]|jgi:hypothetical protein|nr:hypothetical protein [Pirellulales bacterium]
MMGLAENIANDLKVLDGAMTVIVTTAAGISVTVPDVLPAAAEQQELSMLDGTLGMESRVRTFHLPVASLGTLEPACGDLISEADGQRWRVKSVRLATLGTRLKATCFREQ